MTSQNEETTGLLLIVVLVAVVYIGYNFIGKIKAAPITLVPQGTQAAVNPTGQAALNATAVGAAAGQTAAQTLALQQAAAANVAAAQLNNQSAFANVGAAIGNIVSGLSGNNDDDSEDTGY